LFIDALILSRRSRLIFPSICDIIRNFSGMWPMIFPDRYVHYVVDMPVDMSTGRSAALARPNVKVKRAVSL
jgi:hypothetical protein